MEHCQIINCLADAKWVRFVDQSEDQATRVHVPREGIVDDLRAAIATAFKDSSTRPVRSVADIDLKIGDTVRAYVARTPYVPGTH